MSRDPVSLEDFGGTVRLFPLPNLVLFPHVAQPLHIFEARYRQMTVDALDDDRLLTMALLLPGWEEDYHKKPPLHPMVCIGQIHQEERLADGRFNLMLHGISRARIVEELETPTLYRMAEVELCDDVPVASPGLESALRIELSLSVRPYFSAHPPAMAQLNELLKSPLPLGALCDVFAYALPVEMEVKQRLLEELDVEARTRHLLATLAGREPPVTQVPPKRSYPPGFSDN